MMVHKWDAATEAWTGETDPFYGGASRSDPGEAGWIRRVPPSCSTSAPSTATRRSSSPPHGTVGTRQNDAPSMHSTGHDIATISLRTSGGNQITSSLLIATTDVVERLTDPLRSEAHQSKGLVVGYVQSGKTANITGVIAKAIDAGYRLIIVMTGTIELLRSQTQRRLIWSSWFYNIRGDAPNDEDHHHYDYEDDDDWREGPDFLNLGSSPPIEIQSAQHSTRPTTRIWEASS